MGEFGFKIKNYQAGSVYEVMRGTRTQYDSKDAMLTNSLFCDFLLQNGMRVVGDSTRDIICIEFKYGARSYEEEIAHLTKLMAEKENKEAIQYYIDQANAHKDLFAKVSKEDIRIDFYENGVTIDYPLYTPKTHKVNGHTSLHYKMLWRTPGKAKKGSCMFIVDRLYKKAHEFLTMGLKLPRHNSPIVEIGAYQSLITSTIVGRVRIEPENILILKDVDSEFITDVISIETDENKNCLAIPKSNYTIKNTMFDGQALIDSSIFPEDGDGYILLRHHFTKMAAFCSHIQKFFKDYYGAAYDTATITDMFGNVHYAKDIKLITTENAVKYLKFNVDYSYWCDWVHKNDCMFGIVKTAHPSKFGDVQRMSYQMVNALSPDIMDNVVANSASYIMKLKTDNTVFIDYLRRNTNFSNDFDSLIALYENIPDFERSDYFRERKSQIIKSYITNLKTGRTMQNADNLTIVGSPYAMLLHAVGENPFDDPTFQQEEGAIQCWTNRFDNGEYLAEFRNPFNGRNNLGYMHNVHHEYFDRYFELGRLCVAVNMRNTSFQSRNNGSDQDLTYGSV